MLHRRSWSHGVAQIAGENGTEDAERTRHLIGIFIFKTLADTDLPAEYRRYEVTESNFEEFKAICAFPFTVIAPVSMLRWSRAKHLGLLFLC